MSASLFRIFSMVDQTVKIDLVDQTVKSLWTRLRADATHDPEPRYAFHELHPQEPSTSEHASIAKSCILYELFDDGNLVLMFEDGRGSWRMWCYATSVSLTWGPRHGHKEHVQYMVLGERLARISTTVTLD